MSIGMETFGWHDIQLVQKPHNESFPHRIQCRDCGFEPTDLVVPPPRCPKCTGSSWERYANPRSLLRNAQRRAS